LQGFSRAQEHNLAARLARLEQMGLAQHLGQYTWKVRGDFGQILRAMQKSTDRQRMLAKHGALLSDERLPFEFIPFRQFSRLDGRVVAHGLEEDTDRPYLMVEGVDGKVHLLYQNEDIQNARRDGLAGVNSFVRIEKRFVDGRPFVQVDDLGDAHELLKNAAYLRTSALNELQNGTLGIEQTWSGWLGQYQNAVNQELTKIRQLHRSSLDLGR
jgi:hypothetical protein